MVDGLKAHGSYPCEQRYYDPQREGCAHPGMHGLHGLSATQDVEQPRHARVADCQTRQQQINESESHEPVQEPVEQ